MQLSDLLNMGVGEVSDWIEDNKYDYKLAPSEPQWNYPECEEPPEVNQMYWVRNNLNGSIKMCYCMVPYKKCWQEVATNTDFRYDDTSWIMIEQPEY